MADVPSATNGTEVVAIVCFEVVTVKVVPRVLTFSKVTGGSKVTSKAGTNSIGKMIVGGTNGLGLTYGAAIMVKII